MRHIERIKLSGFKSIRQTPGFDQPQGMGGLELRDMNVLIGANGAGKSNFLSFFSLISAMFEKRLQLFVGVSGGANRLLYFGEKITDNISAKIEFEGTEHGTALWHEWKLIPSAGDHLVFEFESEVLYWQNPNSFRWGESPGIPSVLDAGKRGSLEAEGLFHRNNTSEKLRERLNLISPIQVCHFADTGSASPARKSAPVNDNRLLRADGGNIAPFLHLLKSAHPASYTRVLDAVRLVFPFIEDFVLEPLELNKSLIKLEWKESGSNEYRDADYLSDGALRFICLAALALQPEPPGLILIDEPELGLHPLAIRVLAELLQALANCRSQVILSTQSVTLVNQFSPEDLIVVERQKEERSFRYETVFERKSEEDLSQWIDDYQLGEIWEKNLIGGRPTHV